MSQQGRYRFRLSLPYWLVRGRTTPIRVEVYDDETGDPAAPSAATCTLVEPDGTEHVLAGASVSGHTLSADVTSAEVAADEALSARWVVRWTATIGGIVYTAENPAHVVRREPLSPVVAEDLRTRHQVLRTLRTRDKTNGRLLTEAIRDTWEGVLRRILHAGRDPERIMSSHNLFDIVLYGAMSQAFLDGASSLNSTGQLGELGAFYAQRFEKSWNTLKLDYDKDGDGRAAQDEKNRGGPAVLFAGVRRWSGYAG